MLAFLKRSAPATTETPGLPPRELRYPALVVVALVFLALLAVVFVFADLLAPYDYRQQSLLNRLKPPVWLGGDPRFLLGTDELGRDVLSRLIYAIRFSLLVALAGTAIGAVLGTFLGFVAAHFRGVVEEFIMMLVDVQASLPFILIALAVVAFFGGGFTGPMRGGWAFGKKPKNRIPTKITPTSATA